MNEAIEGLNELGSWGGEFNRAVTGTGGYIASAILALDMIYTVWAIAMKKENAKTYLIAWVVCMIFTLLFIL